ncbi:AAA family ATPase [Desulfobacula sp.]|uniref:ATP-binding protein n=1 Tax=Desulfobacula sp. TaxID=2593537 RepID=UPI00260F4D47|nr:AAA family ATPase [Desulfobacula sp.]
MIDRNLHKKLNTLLDFFPAVIILGVRQCGKTTLAKMIRPEWAYFDLERFQDFEFISRDFEFFIKENPHSIIIDEVQQYPELFSHLRGVIDRDRKVKNRFILTGSSSLDLIKNVSQSLAGRVGVIELNTLKANEINSHPLSDFYKIFDKPLGSNSLGEIKKLKPTLSHNQVMDAFLMGGYPEPILENDRFFYATWMENYFQTYVQRDIRSLFPRLDLIKYQRFISMLSALSGTIINRSQTGRSLNISEKSIRDYLDIVQGSYIWRNISSYARDSQRSLTKMPRGNFQDSGLSHFLQRVTNREQLMNYSNVGASFEAFIIEEIIRGIEATHCTNWNYSYYRTRNGAEIDLILQGPFGILPIEIKFGTRVKMQQIQTLKKFVKDNELPLGILINNGEQVQMIADKIIQLPAVYI